MIAKELEVTLHDAFVDARQQRHAFISVEHLLLALLDNASAVKMLDDWGASPNELRLRLSQHIDENTALAAEGRELDTQPTMGFQRVIQRAILQVQSDGGREVTGAAVLRAIVGEKDSYAARLLEPHGAMRPPVTGQAMQESGSESTPNRIQTGGPVAQDLEMTLHRAFVEAREKRHEYITVEHLLLALIHDSHASALLRGCRANMGALRKDIEERIAADSPLVDEDREVDTQPTLGFQRVIQRAILHHQTAATKEVTGADVLIALFGEKDSHAVQILKRHAITRFDVVFYRTHGVAPRSESAEAALPDAPDLQVVIYNDDYTPMEFVVGILQTFFSMSREEANETMLEVHRKGAAVCGLYARDAALALMDSVLDHARRHGHPLHCGVVASPKNS